LGFVSGFNFLGETALPKLAEESENEIRTTFSHLGTIMHALTAKYKVRNLAFSNLFYISGIM
jgi:hypothetical protein